MKLFDMFLSESQIDDSGIFKQQMTVNDYLSMRDFFRKHLGEADEDNQQKRIALFNNADIKKVSIDLLVPMQDYLNIKNVMNSTNQKIPLGIELKDKRVLIFDCHHRIASDILKDGKEIKMKIIKTV
jgi:hypothetical protein